MKKMNIGLIAAGCGLCLGVIPFQGAFAAVANFQVTAGNTVTAYTVPEGSVAYVRSITISNPGTSPECSQEVYKLATGSTNPQVKANLCIPPGSSFTETFSPPIGYAPGYSVQLHNGSGDGTTTSFTVDWNVYNDVAAPLLLLDQ